MKLKELVKHGDCSPRGFSLATEVGFPVIQSPFNVFALHAWPRKILHVRNGCTRQLEDSRWQRSTRFPFAAVANALGTLLCMERRGTLGVLVKRPDTRVGSNKI